MLLEFATNDDLNKYLDDRSNHLFHFVETDRKGLLTCRGTSFRIRRAHWRRTSRRSWQTWRCCTTLGQPLYSKYKSYFPNYLSYLYATNSFSSFIYISLSLFHLPVCHRLSHILLECITYFLIIYSYWSGMYSQGWVVTYSLVNSVLSGVASVLIC